MKNKIVLLLLSAVLAGCSTHTAPVKKIEPVPPKPKTGEVVINGVAGYQDTPLLPGGKWHVHDPARPQPVIVTPGTFSTQKIPGKPPSDAIVLFDGTNLSQWHHAGDKPAHWKIENGAIIEGKNDLITKLEFTNIQLHIEFATPTQVIGSGQGRGNSGVFLMGKYELQTLDSYQNPTYPDGQAGALYGQYPPLVNASLPPGQWQVYDIVFTAPQFEKDGTLKTPAYMTVFHNGVLVQNHQAYLGPSGHRILAHYTPQSPAGPIALQDHGNLTRFRNIWVRPLQLPDEQSAALQTAAPKKLLVVTTTTGYRHASIPKLENLLSQLARDSGEFTVEFVQQPPGKPNALKKLLGLKADTSPEEKAAYLTLEEQYKTDQATFETAEEKWERLLKIELEKLSPENLKNYDGVIFASTTGDLPIPDHQGFLDWIKAGHAFIGIHAAADTFHGWPGYIEMLGGEFAHHGPQVGVQCLNQDPANSATAFLGKTWDVSQEEIYQFKNYDPAKVHELLVMDKHPETKAPGHFGVAWCKDYGKGKVFYTSLGHRDDLIDTDPNLQDRKNSVETAKLYRMHILGGIEWALGFKSKDAHPIPQN